ncbi:hypothetical protein DFS34DRAFT_652760 [Phlyctochytrium arcticum]|nr:hypothetical protein DFS34DRAFT_652760 [Phlyctochytrium arcticum]
MTDTNPPPPLPLELLRRILCRLALTSPQDYLNCLLTCRAWSSLLTSRERCLVKYSFVQDEKEFPVGHIFNDETVDNDGQEFTLDVNKYRIFHRLHVAYLTSEFEYLCTMQNRLLNWSDLPTLIHSNAPVDEQQWSELSGDLDILVRNINIINTFGEWVSGTGPTQEIMYRWIPHEGGMCCPLILAPIPEFDSAADNLLTVLLSRLAVAPHIQQYYKMERALMADEQQAVDMLNNELASPYYHPDDPDSDEDEEEEEDEDELVLRRAQDLYRKLKNSGVVEIVLVGLTADNYDNDLHDGWVGNFCKFILCRREAGRRILGWLCYYNYNP